MSCAAADDALETVTSFYADAGDRALAAVAVDVLCFDEPDSLSRDGARPRTVRRSTRRITGFLASRSGGALFRLQALNAADDDAAFAPPVPATCSARPPASGEARSADDALHPHAQAAPRSAESVWPPLGGRIMPDETYEGLFHVPRCAPGDCFAFDLEHVSARGFGRGGDCPPTVQMASEFTRPDAIPRRAESHRHHRRRRSAARCGVHAAGRGGGDARRDVFADAEATFGVLYRKILDAAEEDGVKEARAGLARRWPRAKARQGRQQDIGARGEARNSKSLVFALDALFANEPALRRLAWLDARRVGAIRCGRRPWFVGVASPSLTLTEAFVADAAAAALDAPRGLAGALRARRNFRDHGVARTGPS